MITLRCCLLISLAAGSDRAFAETVKDREASVRNDRAAMESNSRWIYNEIDRGFDEAKRTGKPLLVILRCVPCLACAGIDAQVLLDNTDLAPLLDQFVRVRVINANALELSRFQFDYDLSFSTMFFNGDGTVYGRYGSWKHQRDPQDKTTASYKHALEAALALHRNYPANQAALAGKQGGPMPFQNPLQIPTLAGKYTTQLDWKGKLVQSCVHCHMIGEAIRASYRDDKKVIPNEWIYPWPAPETIGLGLAADSIARVESVAPGSVAVQARFQSGDEIVSLAGQPLISAADVSWVLHRAPESGVLTAVIKRDGKERPLTINLPSEWRKKSDISRRVGTWGMRGMALGGLVLEDLNDEGRASSSLSNTNMALRIKYVGEYGTHAAGKKAGFKKDDVLVQVDGVAERISEGELIGHLLQKHQPGERVKALVMRGQERMELTLPMQ